MKFSIVLLSLVLLCSCSEERKKPPARPKLTVKDSSIVKNEPANPYVGVDLSPMDMSYFPADYPVLKMTGKTTRPPVARVVYSRPHKQGRKIFGALLKYGEPWRLGANEATEIEFFQPVTIQKTRIQKGKYILYCIPYAGRWTLIFNSNVNTWGLRADSTKDLHRFDIPVQVKNQSVEYFSMIFEKAPGGTNLVIAWDDVEARLPIQYQEL